MRAAWVATCVLFAFSTLGCSRRVFGNQAIGGYEYCNAAAENPNAVVQSMEIFVRRSPSNPTFVELDIRPDSVLQAGVLVSVYLANQSGQFRALEREMPIDAGEEYFLGTFPDTLYESFEFIVVTPSVPGESFLDADGEYTAVCYRPLLGDGLDQFGNPVGG
jgi:hypothetical protein